METKVIFTKAKEHLSRIKNFKYNFLKISIVCGCTFLFGIVFAYVIFPPILRAVLRSMVTLKPGTLMRGMYDVLPFPMIFKVYFFNVLNPDDVMVGQKPILQEVGPFVFHEWKEKINEIEDTNLDTIEFTEKKTFYFNQDLSGMLSGNEIITIIHPLILGTILTVQIESPKLLNVVSKAINVIFKNPSNIFWTGRAMDILFDGIEINCTSNNAHSRVVCAVFESDKVKQVRLTDVENMFRFSIFSVDNGTEGSRFKTYRGVKNLDDLGRIIEYNGSPTMATWSGDECNAIRGTESSVFPPFMNKKEGIWAFEGGICRSIQTVYEKPSRYSGIPTSRHIANFGDFSSDERLKCFCPNGDCPLRGTMNLWPCINSPLIASLPHFYNGDAKLLEAVESGLYPEKEKHGIFLDIEPISGVPLRAAKRVQLNMNLKPLQQLHLMKNISQIVFPIGWFEESVALNKTYVNILKNTLFLGLKLKAVVKWSCLIIGSIGCISSGYIHYTHKNKIGDNTDVRQTTANGVEVKVSSSIMTGAISNIEDNNDSGLNSKSSSASGNNPRHSP